MLGITFLAISPLLNLYSQEGIQYMGSIYDASGLPLNSVDIEIQINIYDDLAGSNLFYGEEHITTTAANGVFSIVIGNGAITGGISLDLVSVPWKQGMKFLNVQYREVGGPPAYFNLGTTQFNAVPFAFHSLTTDQTYSVSGLNDVDTSGIQVGQTLIWDGFNWVVGSVDTVNYSATSGYSSYSDTAYYGYGSGSVDTAFFSYISDSANYANTSGYAANSDNSVWADTAQYAVNALNSWDLNGNAVSSSSFVGTTDTSDLRFFTDSIERMVIKSDGRIGIGVSDPIMDIEIDGQNGISMVSDLGAGNSYSFTGDRLIWYPRKAHMYSGGGSVILDDSYLGNYSVGLGYNVVPRGDYSLAMGRNSESRGNYSFAGGDGSLAAGAYSFSFGFDSYTVGECSIGIGRGAQSTGQSSVALGYHPRAFGAYSYSVGYYSFATDTSSFALGYRAQSIHKGSFVYADNSSNTAFVSTAENQFLVRVSNGARFYSSSDLSSGVQLAPGSGSWSTLSDSTKKKNIELVNELEILKHLKDLDVYEWSYKAQNDSIVHIGPMAQDFSRVFGLGESNTMISTVDIDGVNIAALKGLFLKMESLEQQLNDYEALQDKYDKLRHEKQGIMEKLSHLEKLMLDQQH